MSFGGKTTEELKKIIGDIQLEHILSAFKYVDSNGISARRNADTCYFIYKETKYPVKLITEIINNNIKNNPIKLKAIEHNSWQDLPLFDNINFPYDLILISLYNKSGRELVEKYRTDLLNSFSSCEPTDVGDNYTKLSINKKNIAEIHFLEKNNQFKIIVNYNLLPPEMRSDKKKSVYGFEKLPDSYKWTLNGQYYVTTNPQTYEFACKALNYLINVTKSDSVKTYNNEDSNILPVNLILYGPPGTGKTYNSVVKAMEIIDRNCVHRDGNGEVLNYRDVKGEFDKALKNHQIEFITFHQSYSYEDFVEGIKPDFESDELKYKLDDGIFKQICKNAEQELYLNNNAKFDFDKAFGVFQEKYDAGSSFSSLVNIQYEKNFLVYHFGKQLGARKIDLKKIKELFNSNKKYTSSSEFNNDYKGNVGLKGYIYNFYNELVKLKEDYYKENVDEQREIENPRKFVLIIDEINRGDISKIFGELITLIEGDKRIGAEHQMKVILPYSKESFGVPKNLYIIGTMNTADRSIALLDTALRRRFDFEEMPPKPKCLKKIEDIKNINLQLLLEQINKRIVEKYDRDHQIGHSYFIDIKTEEDLIRVYKNRILPLLKEYFYNDLDAVKYVLNCSDVDLESMDVIKILGNAQNEIES